MKTIMLQIQVPDEYAEDVYRGVDKAAHLGDIAEWLESVEIPVHSSEIRILTNPDDTWSMECAKARLWKNSKPCSP